jgi:hypothetical protein
MPECPFNNSEKVLRVTPKPFAASVTVKPKGSRHNSRIVSPGWGGFSIAIFISFKKHKV